MSLFNIILSIILIVLIVACALALMWMVRISHEIQVGNRQTLDRIRIQDMNRAVQEAKDPAYSGLVDEAPRSSNKANTWPV